MKIENLKIADLKPLEKNVRKHNEKQITELKRSLEQFGQTRAIVIDEDNNILIGNGLYFAMKSRGDETAECSRINGLSESQKKKLILTDNKVFSLGVDDYENIEAFIKEITFDGDFDIAGFDNEVLQQMQRELSQINNDVMNYGNVPENYVKEHKPEVTQPQPQPTYQETHVQNNTNTYQAAEYTPAPTTAEVQNDRTIICPSCGEVIHLD